MMRQRLLDQAEVVADGGEPKAVVRDPAENACIGLPIIDRELLTRGYSRGEGEVKRPPEFRFQVGQPEAVRRAYWQAMGYQSDRDAP
jgi:5,5'-dehydrodivanillate O-demethylase